MSKFELVLEHPPSAFLDVILYDGEAAFSVSDTTEKHIRVEDMNDLNNKITFDSKHLLDFASFLRENEQIYALSNRLILSSFNYGST